MKHNKKCIFLILSFLIPISIFIVAGYFIGVYPLGKLSSIAYDGAVQHPGFASYFSDFLRGNASLFYSFKGALGYNFYSTSIYYLFSPLNLLLPLFNPSNIHYFYALIVPVKIGLCGISMFIFLSYRKRVDLWTLILSICYSLMAYNVVYYSNYMWIDGIIMLPLVMLGIDKLINGDSKVFYLITLALAIVFNFYIAYMICIFAIIYFVYKMYLCKKRDKKKIVDFIVLSLCAGTICAFIIIPVYLDLLNGKGTTFHHSQYFKFDWDFFKVLYKFMVGSYTSADISYGLPNVYISILVLLLNIIYYFNKNIGKREKILTIIVTLFFLFGFSFNLIDYAWQMFQAPIWFPARYSFVLSFFLVVVAHESIRNLDGFYVKNKIAIVIFVLFFSFVATSAFVDGCFNKTLQIFLLVVSFILFIIYYIFRKKTWIIFIVLVLELTCNTAVTLKKMELVFTMDERSEYSRARMELVKQVDKLEKEDNFYRMELDDTYTNNDGALYGYNGITYFNSLRNSKLIDFFEKYLDVTTDKVCRINYSSFNPILNAFFGVKYSTVNDTGYYEQVIDEDLDIYRNNGAFPLGFMVNSSIYDSSMVEFFPVYNFNILMKDVTGLDDVKFQSVKFVSENYVIKDKDHRRVFQQSKTGYNKIEYGDKTSDSGFLYFNNVEYIKRLGAKLYIDGIEQDDNKLNCIIYLDKEVSWKIVIESDSTTSMPYEIYKFYTDMYFLDDSSYEVFLESGKKEAMTITDYKQDDYIKGKLDVLQDGVLLTTIPYDKGWSVFVDGEKVEVKKIYDVFIGIDLTKGKHEVEFKYFPPGLKCSIPISLFGCLISSFYIYKKKH